MFLIRKISLLLGTGLTLAEKKKLKQLLDLPLSVNNTSIAFGCSTHLFIKPLSFTELQEYVYPLKRNLVDTPTLNNNSEIYKLELFKKYSDKENLGAHKNNINLQQYKSSIVLIQRD